MKKLNTLKEKYRLHAGWQRFMRGKKPKPPPNKNYGRSRGKKSPFIEAPLYIDIYKRQNRNDFIKFISEVQKAGHNRNSITIRLRNTEVISAAAALVLYAEVHKILISKPTLKIKCTLPSRVRSGKYKTQGNLVESSLKQIGFFDLIGQESQAKTNHNMVRRWKLSHGKITDGSLAGNLIDSLSGHLDAKARKRIYRGAIEAIANSVEHAYPEKNDVDNQLWWMLVGIDAQSITIIVCDLGVGIPNTLDKHDANLLNKILARLKVIEDKESDAIRIRVSTYLKESRTNLSHRGKGGKDVRSIVSAFPSARLSIRSNKGLYAITGKNCLRAPKAKEVVSQHEDYTESVRNERKSLRGTMIEWVLSTEDATK